MGDDDAAMIRRMAGLATPMTLRVAVTLGLPDRLLDDGATADRLAAELEVSPAALEVLLAHLATLGMVEHADTGYRTTALGRNLCADARGGFTHNLLHLDRAGGRAELAYVELAHSIATGRAAYPRRYGRDFWSDLAEHPHLRASFDRQMTQRFRDQVPRLVTGFDWSRFAGVVDVGGGNGTLLAAVLAANPAMTGHLVELEGAAAEAERAFRANGLGARARVTAGSFFDPLPAGAQAYLLCDVLHNWDDDSARRILRRCVEAAGPGGRVLVVEALGGGVSTEMDLTMLVTFGGRERGVDDLRSLAAAEGLVLEGVTDVTGERWLLEFRLAG